MSEYYERVKELEEFIKLAESRGEMEDAKAALDQYEQIWTGFNVRGSDLPRIHPLSSIHPL